MELASKRNKDPTKYVLYFVKAKDKTKEIAVDDLFIYDKEGIEEIVVKGIDTEYEGYGPVTKYYVSLLYKNKIIVDEYSLVGKRVLFTGQRQIYHEEAERTIFPLLDENQKNCGIKIRFGGDYISPIYIVDLTSSKCNYQKSNEMLSFGYSRDNKRGPLTVSASFNPKYVLNCPFTSEESKKIITSHLDSMLMAVPYSFKDVFLYEHAMHPDFGDYFLPYEAFEGKSKADFCIESQEMIEEAVNKDYN